jgi:hypothetical protein
MRENSIDKTSSAQARGDVMEMFRQMSPALGVLALGYFLATMAWLAAPAIISTWLGQYVVRMMLFMGLVWAGAPFMLSLYRFVALREAHWPPSLSYDKPTRIFASYAALLTALYFIPSIGFEVAAAFGGKDVAVVLFVALVLSVWVVVIRSTTLLPMAALDPQSASWPAAFAQSGDRVFSTFLATTVPVGPSFAALLILGGLIRGGLMNAALFFPVAILLLLSIQLLPLAAATHLYLERRRETRN